MRRSPIWGDLDLHAFCRITGYSREHATRELSKIRRSGEFAFETKLRTRPGRRSRNWGVIVADPKKLRFDRRSLHFSAEGTPLRNRTTLATEGEKLVPFGNSSGRANEPASNPAQTPKPFMDQNHPGATMPRSDISKRSQLALENLLSGPSRAPAHRGCDNAYKEDSSGIQQSDLYGAERPIAQWRGPEASTRRAKAGQRLRRRAFALAAKLKESHWDNCKVRFNARGAFALAHGALRDGHDAEQLVACYAQALFKTHGHAVDQAASTGHLVFFNLSSTLVETRRLLARDGLTREQRVRSWYERRHALDAEIRAAFAQLRKRLGSPGDFWV